MTCPQCESAELRWAAVWARGTMVAECRRCGSVYNAPSYGTLVEDGETAYGTEA